ncbi:hypothetical protein ABMA27_007582 [Loxostege sticticalis]|uniref:XRCC4 n=1 Tax=Loxostege sticticalis TaxID=481309 RepID=A0ABR3HFZ1_LOXSC
MEPKISSKTSISKFIIKGENIYVRLLWEDNENELFRIKIFDGNNSWSGRFSTEFSESCRSLVDETEDQYKNNVRRGLSGTQKEFTYDFFVLPEDESTARFTWKKVFDDSTVMAHGSVPVHKDDAKESKDTLIDFLLYENSELREVIEANQKKNEALSENLDKCKRELEEFVNMKTSLETSLYGKFIQLLNEKKRRILLLEENIQNF